MQYANLDFEYELRRFVEARRAVVDVISWGRSYEPDGRLKAILEAWSSILNLLPDQPCIAWGMSPSAFAKMADEGFLLPSFGPDLVVEVNDKRFSHGLEVELGTVLPGARVVASLEELEGAVAKLEGSWVAKHPLGVSGRDRILSREPELGEEQRRWAARQFEASWELVFEPWVAVDREYSLQFEVDGSRETSFLGALELVTDASGTHRGHRPLDSEEVRAIESSFVEVAARGVERIAEKGYIGPVGVDAFRGQLGDQSVERPITEINARVTFGRLALELEKFVPEGNRWQWWHPSRKQAAAIGFENLPCIDGAWAGPGDYRLPNRVDPRGRSHSLIRVTGG